MNEKGLTLFKLIGFFVIIGALLTFVAPSVTNFFGSTGKLATFLSYEDKMGDAAIDAVRNCVANGSLDCVNPSKGEYKNINLSYLINKGYIDDIKSPTGGQCSYSDSYVRVQGNGNLNYSYMVCLVCEDYKTNNPICE